MNAENEDEFIESLIIDGRQFFYCQEVIRLIDKKY